MAIFGSSFFDLVTGAIGAYMYQIVWNVMVLSGFVLLAFLSVIIGALIENYESDQLNDEPHQQLGRFQVKMIIMVIVILVAALPLIPVSGLKLSVPTRQCEIIPQVASETLNLSSENQALLTQYGAKELVRKLTSEKIHSSKMGSEAATTAVARDILSPRLLSEFNRLKSKASGAYNTPMPSSMILENVVREGIRTKQEAQALSDIGLTLDGLTETIRVPIWWQAMRNWMLGTSAAIQAKIPCDSGVRIAKERMDTEFIDDPIVQQNFLDFYEQCHAPSLAKWKSLQTSSRLGLSGQKSDGLASVSVPGNRVFLEGESFYSSIQTSTPVSGFGSSSEEQGYKGNENSAGSSNPTVPSGTGFPFCDKWWSDKNNGLERQLIVSMSLDSPDGIELTRKVFNAKTTDDSELLQIVLASKMRSGNLASQHAAKAVMEKLQGAYLSSHEVTAEGQNIGGTLLGIAVDWGVLTSYSERMAGLKALLRAAPMATALLIMFFTAMLPLGLIVGRFDLGPLMALTMTYCSIYLWIPYFRMVKWVDDNLVSIFMLSWASTDKMMIDFMVGAAYIGVPMFITSVVGLAGVKVAQFDPVGAATMGSVGQGGMKNLTNIVKMLGSKGAKAMK
ncbi:TPA: conjugal transfer protein TraG N-terminal domain-containing protein [Vibrio cholerae]